MYDPKRKPLFIPAPGANPKEEDMLFKPSESLQIPHSHSKLVYICSPYDPSNYDKSAAQMLNESFYSVFVVRSGCLPLAPHVLVSFLRGLPDQEIMEKGVICEHELIHACDELWVFIEYGMDYGMYVEIQIATHLNKPIHIFDKDFREVKI